METSSSKINLMNCDRLALQNFLVEQGEKPFRATQILQWIHHFGVTDFALMTNLSKDLRQKFTENAEITAPQIAYRQHSTDGTRKWLIQLADGNKVETVFIPEDDRGTLCVSSQVGCGLNCSFCSTAQQGFNRNLTVAEIIGQVWVAVRELSKEQGKHDKHITNVVMMGMGEPLLNFDAVVAAMNIMRDDFGYGLSKYRVTLSTSGVLPAMRELSKKSDVALAVSLHAPTDELRNILVPINKKYPIKELLTVCREYFAKEPRRKVTFEYVMLDGVNDKDEHAKQLVRILQNVPCKVNLIPFNPFPNTVYRRSSNDRINRFKEVLQRAGIITITRKTRGDDIDAACGQLVGQVQDRTQRSSKRLIAIRAEKHMGQLKDK